MIASQSCDSKFNPGARYIGSGIVVVGEAISKAGVGSDATAVGDAAVFVSDVAIQCGGGGGYSSAAIQCGSGDDGSCVTGFVSMPAAAITSAIVNGMFC
ncbi:Hypothetical predicted protein [Octopus vulgaris]|uniref:Uncharacterized protein n=1 Tax=Octopus vulgaris TaxID=6645 RepID=A0AA36F433_OCTVU|nr:Hypothetical predicted protein [Octopus vulgaris]